MLILKYHGNLTIGEGVTIQPQVRKKGMVIYVEGTLTNNGTGLTITQDSRYNTSQPVGSVIAPITVSAYQNFPQVYVSANGDKTNYSISANSDKTGYSVISIPQAQISGVNDGLYIGTSAYTNFPQVYVSAISPGINISATVTDVAVASMTSAAVQDILNGIVDTKTLSQVFTILLANVVGDADRSGYVFTYKKQDGSTTAFLNTMTSLTRRRTD
jgi:hypothetical protein